EATAGGERGDHQSGVSDRGYWAGTDGRRGATTRARGGRGGRRGGATGRGQGGRAATPGGRVSRQGGRELVLPRQDVLGGALPARAAGEAHVRHVAAHVRQDVHGIAGRERGARDCVRDRLVQDVAGVV